MIRSIIASLLFAISLSATVINVPADQTTIQAGINVAVEGDTVLVQPGTYVENIIIDGKDITVGSLFLTTQDTSYISQTIIDGNQLGSVIQILNSETGSVNLIGLSIQNGTGTNDEVYSPWVGGGGIFTKDANVNIDNCVITNCTEQYRYGGGILFYPSSKSLNLISSTINNCNSNDNGGGLALFSGNFTLTDVVVESCAAYPGAGGVYVAGDINIANSQFKSNTGDALQASGLMSAIVRNSLFTKNLDTAIEVNSGASVQLNNVDIVNNYEYSTSQSGTGILLTQGGHIDVINCVLWNNPAANILFNSGGDPNTATIAYSIISSDSGSAVLNNNGTLEWGLGNINIDPRFINAQVDNYKLLASSPCINAGHPDSTDSDGSRADMGAFPYLNAYSGPDWHTTTSGSDISGTGAISNPFASIQAGVNFASSGDSVLVGPGTYYETLVFRGQDIDVRGSTDPSNTIIDANGNGRVITYTNSETAESSLSGFTIQNGNSEWWGGGIFCDRSSPTLSNLIVKNNTSVQGGGLCLNYSNSSLTDISILNNTTIYNGGGVWSQTNSVHLN